MEQNSWSGLINYCVRQIPFISLKIKLRMLCGAKTGRNRFYWQLLILMMYLWMLWVKISHWFLVIANHVSSIQIYIKRQYSNEAYGRDSVNRICCLFSTVQLHCMCHLVVKLFCLSFCKVNWLIMHTHCIFVTSCSTTLVHVILETALCFQYLRMLRDTIGLLLTKSLLHYIFCAIQSYLWICRVFLWIAKLNYM